MQPLGRPCPGTRPPLFASGLPHPPLPRWRLSAGWGLTPMSPKWMALAMLLLAADRSPERSFLREC